MKKNFLSGILALSLGVMLLLKSGDLGEGIRKGLYICSFSVIPSLFPFMVLSVFICKSSCSEFFSALLKPLTKILKIPPIAAGAFFSSLIGGYPTAAKCINDLVHAGFMDRKTGARMLCFCVNAGPPFLISTIGLSIFGNIKTGVLIFAAQLLSSFLIGLLLSVFSKKQDFKNYPKISEYKSSASIAVESVVSAAKSCFIMCSFIILFYGVLELLQGGIVFSALSDNPMAKTLLCGFLEVTTGVFSAGEIPGYTAVIISGAIVSFSGVSVILQITATVDESKIPVFPFILSRFFHSAFTAGFLAIFFAFSKETASAFSIRGTAAEAVLSVSAPAAVSLLCLASLFLLSIVPEKSQKEPLFSRIKYKLALFRHGQIKKSVIK
ncbi:MAG: hypothetical protein IKU42_07390 [Oscillospiraceae bacterium]|nr:hypothetical protein [Oscillospiraceae bacterium]